MSCVNTKTFYSNISLAKNELLNTRIENKTTAGRLSLVLNNSHDGYIVWDIDVQSLYVWQDSQWYKIGPDPAEADTLDTVTTRGNITANNITVGNITATSFIKVGGTQTQFLKADGSVDSNTYITIAALAGYATENWVSTNFYTKTQINDFFSGAQVISGYNKINWDSAYNSVINSASFNTATGELVLVKRDASTVTVDLDGRYILSGEKGQPNGVATLDGTGRVPAAQLPSYVDDVVEYANLAGFPGTGENGKIYVALDTNKIYRWSGSVYIEISSNDITGSGVTNYTARWTSANTLGTGVLYDNGTNVGIGTTSPAHKLDINGGAIFLDSDWPIYLGSTNAFIEGNSSGTIVRINGSAGFKVTDGGDTRFLIDTNGNVGIGTSSPSTSLHVYGSTPVRAETPSGNTKAGFEMVSAYYGANPGSGLYFYPGGPSAGNNIFGEAASNLIQTNLFQMGAGTMKVGTVGLGATQLYTNSLPRLTVSSDGNVGINNNAPSYKLHVNGTVGIQGETGTDPGLLSLIAESDFPNRSGVIFRSSNATLRASIWHRSYDSGNNSGQMEFMSTPTGTSTTSSFQFMPVDDSSKAITIGVGNLASANTGLLSLGSTYSSLRFRFNATDTVTFLSGGNVGIGTTAPSEALHVVGRIRVTTVDNGTGDFLTLSATGVITDRTAAQVLTDIGAQPLLTNPVTGTGVATRVAFWNSTSALSSSANLYWDNTNSRLGIGTTSPSSLLHLSNSVGPIITMDDTAGRSTVFRNVSSSTAAAIGTVSNHTFQILTNNTSRIFLTETGNVGIGTTSPAEKLDINGGNVLITSAAPYISLKTTQTGTPDWKIYNSYNVVGDFTIVGGSSVGNKFNIQPNGNVGIGTTNPLYNLHVSGNSTGTPQRIVIQNLAAGQSSYDLITSAQHTRLITSNSKPFFIYDQTATSELFTILSGGNVGINTTTPSQKLHVVGSAYITGALYDSTNSPGTAGQVLTSTATGTDWKSLSEITGVDGTGSTNFIAKWSDVDTITNSQIFDNGTNVGIGTTTPSNKLQVVGTTNLLNITGAASGTTTTLFSIDGANGRLFEVSDDLSDSLFSVNTIAGLPVMEAFSDYRVKLGPFANPVTITSNGDINLNSTGQSIKWNNINILNTTSVYTQIYTPEGVVGINIGDSLDRSNYYDNNAHSFRTASGAATLAFLNSTGLGIGTTSPAQKLHVVGTIRQTGVLSSLLKTNASGDLIAAVAGTDYQNPITLTTTGSSGSATLVSNTLNVPTYTLSGLGGQPLNTNLTSLSSLSYASTSFVKMTAAGTFALDTNTYYLASNPNGYTTNTGTVTTLSVVSANGFAGTVATASTTPAITLSTTVTGLLKGNGTAISAAVAGVDYQAPITNNVTGTGTATRVAFWDSSSSISSDGTLYWDNTNKRLGIGTTTPGDTLTVSGTFRSTSLWTTSAGVTHWGANTTAYGTLTWDTGYARIHANTGNRLDLGAGGGLHMSISTAGNIGIGTTSPESLLHLNKAAAGAIGPVLYLDNSAASTLGNSSDIAFSTWLGESGTSPGAKISVINTDAGSGANAFTFFTKTTTGTVTEKVRITSEGNVGIGTISPTSKLDVNNTTAASSSGQDTLRIGGSIDFANAGSGPKLTFYRQDNNVNLASVRAYTFGSLLTGLAFDTGYNALTTKMVIDNAGNVGIGTTSPVRTLDVVGTARISGQIETSKITNLSTVSNVPADASLLLYAPTTTNNYGGIIGWAESNIAASISSYDDGSGGALGLALSTGNATSISERMRITSGGNVGIGTTSPTERLHVEGRIRVTTVDNGIGDFLTLSATGVITDRTAAQVLTDIGGAPASGSGNYIQNQTASAQSASYRISGTSQAVSYQTTTFNSLTTFGISLDTFGSAIISVPTTYTGGWARGTSYTTAATTNVQAALGLYGTNTTAERLYMSFGAAPWGGTGLFVTSANNVGIGDTAPSDKLVVNGRIRVQGTNALAFGSAVGGYAQISISGATTGNLLFTTYDGAAFGERMRITTTGNVGIGTTNPSQKLEVVGNIESANARTKSYSTLTGTSGQWYPIFVLSDSDSQGTVLCNLRTYAHSSVTFSVARGFASSLFHAITIINCQVNPNGDYANITGIRIQQSGSVEIQLTWSTGPSVNIGLQVIGTTATPVPVAALTATTDISGVVDTTTLNSGASRTRNGFYAGSNVQLINSGTSFLNGGNVGIGTTTPSTKLHIVQTSALSTRESLMKLAVSDAGNDAFYIANGTSTDNTFWPAFAGYGESTTRSGIQFFGLLPASADSSDSSDRGILNFEALRTTSATDPLNGTFSGIVNRKLFTFSDINGAFINIYPSRNISIGAAFVPSARLHVRGSGSTSATTSFRAENLSGSASMVVLDNGNVGIGITAPLTKLVVSGSDDAAATGVIEIQTTGGTNLKLGGNTTYSWIQTHGSKPLYINSLGNNVIFNNGGGNVGIGTITPSQKLHVDGSVRVTGAYYDSANSAGTSGQILSSTVTGTSWINNTVQTAVNNGKITVGSLTGTTEMAPLPIATYDGAIYHYVVKNGANLRAGTINAVWNGTVVSYTEVSTSDIGSTSGVLLSITISGTDAVLNVTVPASGWSIKVVPIGI
jgi:hypothetical protein